MISCKNTKCRVHAVGLPGNLSLCGFYLCCVDSQNILCHLEKWFRGLIALWLIVLYEFKPFFINWYGTWSNRTNNWEWDCWNGWRGVFATLLWWNENKSKGCFKWITIFVIFLRNLIKCNFRFGFLEAKTNSIYKSILEQKIGPRFVLMPISKSEFHSLYIPST